MVWFTNYTKMEETLNRQKGQKRIFLFIALGALISGLTVVILLWPKKQNQPGTVKVHLEGKKSKTQ